MATAHVTPTRGSFVHWLGRCILDAVSSIGDLTLFALQTIAWTTARWPRKSVVLPVMYQVGVSSLPVICITGGFIGMVLAVQTFDQFKLMHMETRLGSVINASLVRELGPVLAATMLAGRIGSAMAAELGTMRVTEQIDALRALGANPIQHLALPRFLACFLLIPLLTIVADGVGIVGGWLFSTRVLDIDSFHYWKNAEAYVTVYDVISGLVKSVFFGASIATIACHRGFHCGAGAEGVGQAATEAFVYSFIAILTLDFLLGILLNTIYYLIWPANITLM